MDDMQWDTERRRPWQPPAVKPAVTAAPAARTLSKDIETSAMMISPPLAARAWHSARTANAVRTH